MTSVWLALGFTTAFKVAEVPALLKLVASPDVTVGGEEVVKLIEFPVVEPALLDDKMRT